jgi:hypothetical protein
MVHHNQLVVRTTRRRVVIIPLLPLVNAVREVSGQQLRLQFWLEAISAPELHAYRTPAHYVYAHKLHVHEMAAYKIHAYGIHALKVYANKMRP